MKVRPSIPLGRTGLVVLAAAAVPLILSRSKRLTKTIGERLVQWGERLQDEAEKMKSPEQATASSNSDVTAESQSEHLESASPTGKEEIKEQIASGATGKKAPPKSKSAPKKPTAPKAAKTTSTNPKTTAKRPQQKKPGA